MTSTFIHKVLCYPPNLSHRNCPHCNENVKATQRLSFWTLPPVLILHLVRSHNNRAKIESLVEYPLTGLNLKRFMTKRSEPQLYDLVAVSNHIGGELGVFSILSY